jgi:hypothetical protein
MFYALTKSIEESFFAENMSAFIALGPCLISPEEMDYETFIDEEWEGFKSYPNIFGEDWSNDGFCEASNYSGFCEYGIPYSYYEGAPSADSRSFN